MSEIPLNKFEKHDLVIKLHKEGKTYREICHIAHICPRDIKLIIKKYEQKLKAKKINENNPSKQNIKKQSLSTRTFILYKEGKQPIDVAIGLDIPYVKALKFWAQFLKLERMYDCYEFYQVCRNDLPTFLSIKNFLKRNNISGTNTVNVLKLANDTSNLQSQYANLKNQVDKLKQQIIDSSLRLYPPLQPLPRYPPLQPLPRYPPNYFNYPH